VGGGVFQGLNGGNLMSESVERMAAPESRREMARSVSLRFMCDLATRNGA
jgi:hypothetical protein